MVWCDVILCEYSLVSQPRVLSFISLPLLLLLTFLLSDAVLSPYDAFSLPRRPSRESILQREILADLQANRPVFLDEIQFRPDLIVSLIASVDQLWHVRHSNSEPVSLVLAGTPAIGTSAVHFTDHDIGKTTGFHIPPFSVLELLKFLPMVQGVKADLSLSELWTLWSFYGGSISYIKDLFATGELVPVLTKINRPGACLIPLLEKAKKEHAHIRTHAPQEAIERLTMLPFEHQDNILKNAGYTYLRDKELVELHPKVSNTKKKQAVLQSGFLKNVMHMAKHVKPFDVGVLATLQGQGLESLLADLVPDLHGHDVWPFPFEVPKERFSLSEVKLFVGERDVDGIFELDFCDQNFIDLVIYDCKRNAKAFDEILQKRERTGKGKSAKTTVIDEGNHFKIFFKYNIEPYIPACEELSEKKVRKVHIVALPGLIEEPDTTASILENMQSSLDLLQREGLAGSWHVHVQTLDSLTGLCAAAKVEMESFDSTVGWPLVARSCYKAGWCQFMKAQELRKPLLVRGLRRIGKSQFLQFLRSKLDQESIYTDLKTVI